MRARERRQLLIAPRPLHASAHHSAPPSPHRCAARGWRELLRALEHERCLGLRPLIALDAAVTTAAAMAAAADANAGTTDARSVNAGASDARSVNRTLAAVGSGRTESHSDVGIGLRLSHSDVGIGLIFSEATSLWESLRLLDAHDDAHDDDAHDDDAHDDDDDDVAVAEAAGRSSDAARPAKKAKEAKEAKKARAAMVPAWAKGIATAWRLDPWEGPQFPTGAVPSVGHGRMRLKMRRDFAPSSHVLASLDRSASSGSSEKPRPPPPAPPPPPPVVELPEVGPEENDSEEEEEEEAEEEEEEGSEEEEGARDGASEAVARDSNPKSDLTNPKSDLGRAGSMFGSVVPSAEERLSNDARDDAPLAARDDARVPLGRRPSFSSARDDAPLAARDDALERRPSVLSRCSSDRLDVADGMHAEAVNVPNASATSAGTTSAAPGTSFSSAASASAAPAPWLAWLSISSSAPELAPAQHGAVEQGHVKAKALETALEANTQTRQVVLDTALGSPARAPDAPSRAPPDGAKLSAMARRSFVVDGPLLLSARCHLVRDCT